jgi:peptidoglycan hydrolase CwlO-like protein
MYKFKLKVMKTYLLPILFLLISLSAAKAQKPLTISNDAVKFGNTECPGIWIDIPEVQLEKVRGEWKKAIEKGTKSKALTTGNEITIFGANIKEVYEGPVNLFSLLKGQDSLVKLFVSVELTRDLFPGVDSKEHAQLKAFVKQFAKDQYAKVAKDQLSDQESKLKNLEKEMSSLRKEKEKFERDIQSANSSISQEEYKIATVHKEMAVTDGSLDAASTELITIDDGSAKKAKQSEIKDLQKKQKDQMKNVNTSESKISKSKQTITDSENAITVNLAKQEELTNLINAQKTVVSRFADKLKTIESY